MVGLMYSCVCPLCELVTITICSSYIHGQRYATVLAETIADSLQVVSKESQATRRFPRQCISHTKTCKVISHLLTSNFYRMANLHCSRIAFEKNTNKYAQITLVASTRRCGSLLVRIGLIGLGTRIWLR